MTQILKKPRIADKEYYKQYQREHPHCEWTFIMTGQLVPVWLGPHHIRYRSEGGSDTWEDLISLSERIHTRAHQNKKFWKKVFMAYKEYMKEIGKE